VHASKEEQCRGDGREIEVFAEETENEVVPSGVRRRPDCRSPRRSERAAGGIKRKLIRAPTVTGMSIDRVRRSRYCR